MIGTKRYKSIGQDAQLEEGDHGHAQPHQHHEDKKTLERELFAHELIPQEPTYLSFMEKFLELQIKMLLTNQENVQNHNYASDPTEWPFLTRGIAYYISKKSNVRTLA